MLAHGNHWCQWNRRIGGQTGALKRLHLLQRDATAHAAVLLECEHKRICNGWRNASGQIITCLKGRAAALFAPLTGSRVARRGCSPSQARTRVFSWGLSRAHRGPRTGRNSLPSARWLSYSSSSVALFLQELNDAHFKPSELQIKVLPTVHDVGRHYGGVRCSVRFGPEDCVMFWLCQSERPETLKTTAWQVRFIKF